LNNSTSTSRKTLIAFALIAGISAAGFMGFLMYKMVSLMEEMTGHVSDMSTNTASMSKVMTHVGQDMHLMQIQVADISTRIMLMDNHMYMMNKSISSIQTRLADNMGHITEDMRLMLTDIHALTGSIQLMTTDVHNMSLDMHRMGYDIYRGSSSFTSPPSFLRNMMNPR
jgi:tRNA A-37 threonylcarbamoyl transferase component Bud32